MFGQNPVAKNEISGDGLKLRVVEGRPFYTIQGEGPYAGMPAVFLRLHGCPLRCFFCDTQFSNEADPYVHISDLAEWCDAMVPEGVTKLLVITGGEPVRQNLSLFIEVMVCQGWTVQIETAGILWQDCLLDTVIVCSPKTPAIHPKIMEHAHAFKYVIQDGQTSLTDGLPVTNTQQEHGRPVPLARPRAGAPVFLSPMDECNVAKNAINAAAVAAISMEYGYRAGLQLHKIFGLA